VSSRRVSDARTSTFTDRTVRVARQLQGLKSWRTRRGSPEDGSGTTNNCPSTPRDRRHQRPPRQVGGTEHADSARVPRVVTVVPPRRSNFDRRAWQPACRESRSHGVSLSRSAPHREYSGRLDGRQHEGIVDVAHGTREPRGRRSSTSTRPLSATERWRTHSPRLSEPRRDNESASGDDERGDERRSPFPNRWSRASA
jgi:hypothetical protein